MAVKRIVRTKEERAKRLQSINELLKSERPIQYGQNKMTEAQLRGVLESTSDSRLSSRYGARSKLDVLHAYKCNMALFDKSTRLMILKIEDELIREDYKLIFNS